MPEEGQSKPQERIRELESQVKNLTLQVEQLRADREAQSTRGRRANDPPPVYMPVKGRFVMARIILVIMTLMVGCAVALSLREESTTLLGSDSPFRDLAVMNLNIPLLACACLAALAIFAYLMGKWSMFMLLALTTIYSTFGWFFERRPVDVVLSDTTWAILSLTLLTLCYWLFNDLCIRDSRRFGRGKRRHALLAILNAAAFYVFLAQVVNREFSSYTAAVYGGFAVLAVLFAWRAETLGAHRNYLVRLFIAKAVILLNVALQFVLAGEWLLIALAFECLLLAIGYYWSGFVVLKVLDIILLVIATIMCIDAVKTHQDLTIDDVNFRTNWILAAGVAFLFLAISWYYERRVHGMRPRQRVVSGHWFLADTLWDIPRAVVSLLHAAAASLIILALTITDYGDSPTLPYLLVMFGVGLTVIGAVFRTPQIEIGAVLLVIAGHVGYYFFLSVNKPGFADQPRFAEYTIAVALYTYFAAFRWERFTERFRAVSAAEHYLSASIPYVAATVMLATLQNRIYILPSASLGHCGLGFALMALGALLRYTSLKSAALVALGLGTYSFVHGILTRHFEITDNPWIWAYALGITLILAVSERLMYLTTSQLRGLSPLGRQARTLLAFAAATVPFATVVTEVPESQQPLAWLAIAATAAILGTLFAESRYRWVALLVLLATIWVVFRQSHPQNAILFGGVVVVVILLVISWGVTLREKRSRNAPPPPPAVRSSSSHG
ncbi:MAG: hypothetical protein K1Y02_01335 [Candidatus Hydrogenedentes bacterium]|nr:hypothetical protein [Candidatus Hydrogenedentota bacterium]